MQFLITAHDGEGMLPKRMEVRPDHLENVERLGSHVVCAGGLRDADGQLIGSALVMEFDSREELDEYLAGEPYVTAGVWEQISVEPITVMFMNGQKVV